MVAAASRPEPGASAERGGHAGRGPEPPGPTGAISAGAAGHPGLPGHEATERTSAVELGAAAAAAESWIRPKRRGDVGAAGARIAAARPIVDADELADARAGAA